MTVSETAADTIAIQEADGPAGAAGATPQAPPASESVAAENPTGEGDTGDPSSGDAGANEKPLPSIISFNHKFFESINDPAFRLSEHTGEPGLFFHLSEGDVVLSIPGIVREFKLEKTDDGDMLELINECLRFVNEVRIGDPVPPEILTGKASWEVSPRHRQIAYGRLTLQLVAWISGEELDSSNTDDMMRSTEDPDTKKRVNDAFGKAAEALGIGHERRNEVIDLITTLADELCHVEALREQVMRVRMTRTKIEKLRSLYSNDQTISDIANPVCKLMNTAVSTLEEPILQVDGQTGEILPLLRNIAPQVRFVREMRDELYCRLRVWSNIFTSWEGVRIARSPENEELLRETYRFLAPRYMPTDDWILLGKLYSDDDNKSAMRW